MSKDPFKDVTVVMKTYGNHDFTRASTWALRRYYPNLRVIYADGHPEDPFPAGEVENSQLVWVPEGSCEDCNNTAVSLVDTPFTLLMDNDTKVIGKDALPLLMETLRDNFDCAASGWYGLKIKDESTMTAYVGTDFTDHMVLDATQAAFSLHWTDAYLAVGGMPMEPFWPVPPKLWKGVKPTPGFGGDLTLCRLYKEAGYEVISPKRGIPVLHWGQAVEWMPGSKGKSPFDKWWFSHVNHIRCNPLNDWSKKDA